MELIEWPLTQASCAVMIVTDGSNAGEKSLPLGRCLTATPYIEL